MQLLKVETTLQQQAGISWWQKLKWLYFLNRNHFPKNLIISLFQYEGPAYCIRHFFFEKFVCIFVISGQYQVSCRPNKFKIKFPPYWIGHFVFKNCIFQIRNQRLSKPLNTEFRVNPTNFRKNSPPYWIRRSVFGNSNSRFVNSDLKKHFVLDFTPTK